MHRSDYVWVVLCGLVSVEPDSDKNCVVEGTPPLKVLFEVSVSASQRQLGCRPNCPKPKAMKLRVWAWLQVGSDLEERRTREAEPR
ncbi:hypothetical protein GCM10017744_028410 [Streptomyces antimycoticus]|uniref:Uncharacterized protein n=1 Tax=Streptomyces antimycoticus TaxID=68175 RepID=A0A4D4KK96_9ACTN|nr:hypothetical protein SANT12839_073910 [Streptomyces antimycoticus]